MKDSTRENKHRIGDDVQKFDLICQKYSDFFMMRSWPTSVEANEEQN